MWGLPLSYNSRCKCKQLAGLNLTFVSYCYLYGTDNVRLSADQLSATLIIISVPIF